MTSPSTPTTPHQSAGIRTAIRVVLVVGACLVLLSTVGGLTAAAVGVAATRMVADSQPLSAQLRTVTVDTGDAATAVRIRSDASVQQPRVDLRFVTTNRDRRPALAVTSGADTRITVNGQVPGWLGWVRGGELTVVLPVEQARRVSVTTTQQMGVLMVNADLDRLTARSSDGAILLRGSARSMDLQTQNGTIVSRDPISVGESFAATTGDGDIDVQFGSPPRTVSGISGDGNVTFGLGGPGPFAVSPDTGTIDGTTVVRVPRTGDPATAAATVTARSTSGDIRVVPGA